MVDAEAVQNVAVDFVKGKKEVAEVNVIITEQKDGIWVVRGTCPISLCGHPWRESFEVHVDQKGKVRFSSFKLM